MLGEATAVLVALSTLITSQVVLLAFAFARLALTCTAIALLVEAIVAFFMLLIIDGALALIRLANVTWQTAGRRGDRIFRATSRHRVSP